MKTYETGYLVGTFDLFHVGHLNMIEQAKSMSKRLIVGAYNDEFVRFYKADYPFISLEERLRILGAIKYVDQAVDVDFKTADIICAHAKWKYDVHFAGSDHIKEKGAMEERFTGKSVSFEFFPYTSSTSSTKIKSLINSKLVTQNKEKKISDAFCEGQLYLNRYDAVLKSFIKDNTDLPVLIYGAGKGGLELVERLNSINQEILGYIDKDKEKQGKLINNLPCYDVDECLKYKSSSIVINTVYDKKVEHLLKKRGHTVLEIEALRYL